ncbi:MAG: hypothetical protein GY810_18070 [Aureispira sp.]|nr:hypothetical protein [Aureispira sp.]
MNLIKKFKQSIRCGTGEAYLILQQQPNLDVYKYIKKAILKPHAYDPQSEGDRAYYLMQFIDLSPQKEQLIAVVLKGLKKEKKDTWALVQLFRLAEILAKRGNQKAWVAIYNRYHRKTIHGSKWCGEDSILALDGIEGLKYIAHVRGRALSKDKDDWETSFTLDRFQEENPNINVIESLKNAAENRPLINVYLKAIQKTKARWSEAAAKRKPFVYNYQNIKEAIEQPRFFIASPKLKNLSKATIKQLSDDFEQEDRSDIQKKYLRIFSRIPFQNGHRFLLNYAKNQQDAWPTELACEALSFFQHKKIRKFALKQLKNSKNPIIHLPLLISNYKKGDWKLLVTIAKEHDDDDDIHNLVIHFWTIYDKNKTKECLVPLEVIYRKLTCGIHRLGLVKLLWKRKVLSKKIQKELEFDSNEKIRKFYSKIKNKRAKKLS